MTNEILENLAQIKAVCDRIGVLTKGIGKIKKGSVMKETYLDMRLEELEQLQHLTLGLTATLASQEKETANADDSVFFAGELNCTNKPDKQEDDA